MCAAPGGKSFTAAMYAKDGEVLSFDLYKHRTELIKAAQKGLELKTFRHPLATLRFLIKILGFSTV